MRVAVAEDNALLRSGLVLLLREMDMDVTHVAGDGPGLLAGIADDPPDVVMLDARMPPSGTEEGFRTAERVHRAHPGVGILLLSQYDLVEHARRLLEHIPSGVGYLNKDRVDDDQVLKDALVRVAAGEVVLDEYIVRRIAEAAPDELTAPERDVLRHVAAGLSNRAVAATMFVSETTVEKHLTSVFQKLNLPSDTRHNRRVLAILRWLDSR